jgi:UDP-N-acetylmuramoylalanine--D-glutamate ligase
MRVDELRGKRVAIWGFGREGRAALQFLRARDPEIAVTILNDAAEPSSVEDAPLISGRTAVAAAIDGFDVVVKSPGISLYDPLVLQARAAGVRFTSLLNLWFAQPPSYRTICITGTKGKSTTTALLAHMLRGVGWNAVAAGNIGVPVTQLPRDGLDAAVIEVSSYQAADFRGQCDVGVLTSLHQEHLDWHGSVAAYRRDKLNLLLHARHALINGEALPSVRETIDIRTVRCTTFGVSPDLHVNNRYLSRPHNLSNLAGALAVMQFLGIDRAAALRAAETFPPLAHRQQEIGEADDVLYVDDSISTTPEAAIAALEVYRDRAIVLLLGGHDRGIDYTSLLERLHAVPPVGVVLMDAAGKRLYDQLNQKQARPFNIHFAAGMREAIEVARNWAPRGGVILLSPAAPSYGRYRSFIERGQDFARCAGLPAPTD